MLQDGDVVGSLFAHHGCPYLAQSHSMPPSTTMQDETCGGLLYVESRGVEMCGRQCFAYRKFLAYGRFAIRSHYSQSVYSS